MSRIIQEHIKKPLAELLLFGPLKEGGHVIIQATDDGLELEARPDQAQLEHLTEPG